MPANLTEQIDGFLREKWIPGVVDQVGNMSSLLKILMRSNGVTTIGDATRPGLSSMVYGGRRIKRTLKVARVESKGSFKDYSGLKTTPNNKFDACYFYPANYYVALPHSFDEKIADQGTEQVMSWIKTQIDNAVPDLLHLISTGLYNNAAAITLNWNDEQGYGIHGLRELCDTTRSWADINSTTYTWWEPGLNDATSYSNAELSDPTSDNSILNLIRNGVDSCRKAGREPTHIICSHATFNLIEDYVITNKIAGMKTDRASIGYKFIDYRGLEIVPEESDYLPDQYHMFFLRIESGENAPLQFKGRQGAWFNLTDEHPAFNQMANIRYMVASGFLVCDEPRLFGMNTGIGNG